MRARSLPLPRPTWSNQLPHDALHTPASALGRPRPALRTEVGYRPVLKEPPNQGRQELGAPC